MAREFCSREFSFRVKFLRGGNVRVGLNGRKEAGRMFVLNFLGCSVDCCCVLLICAEESEKRCINMVFMWAVLFFYFNFRSPLFLCNAMCKLIPSAPGHCQSLVQSEPGTAIATFKGDFK